MGVHITPMQALLRSSDSPVEARRTCRSAGRWYMVGRKKDGVALPSSSATKRESAGGAFSFRDGSWLVQQPLGKYVGSGKSIRVSSSPGLDVDVDVDPIATDLWTHDVQHAYEGRSSEPLGFVVNGGVNWLRATPPTIRLVRTLVERCGIACDDQNVLNELLLPGGGLEMRWDDPNTDKNTKADTDTNTNTKAAFMPSRTGTSPVTKHTAKTWDGSLVFRGTLGVDQCPPAERIWITMPVVSSDSLGPLESYRNGRRLPNGARLPRKLTRDTAQLHKLAALDIWDQYCGYDDDDESPRAEQQQR
mmetsp:Transcript_29095/g.68407  ORF Transcript_29095/g.68407 Transcript_29095/m.68407 type:complete len:304 (+) Transcript_29095:1176-2087(+)